MKQLSIITLVSGSLLGLPVRSEESSREEMPEYRFPLSEKLIQGLDHLSKDTGSLVETLQNLGITFAEGSSASIDRDSGVLTIKNTAREALMALGQVHRFAHQDMDALVSYVELSSPPLSDLPFSFPKHFAHEVGGVGVEGGASGSFQIDARPYKIRYSTGDIYDTNAKLKLKETENLVYYEETAIRGAEVQFMGYRVGGSESKVVLHLWIPEIMTRFMVNLESRDMISMAIRDLREISTKQ